MNEFQLIKLLTTGLYTNTTVKVGPGDDCAVLDLQIPGQLLLFKTDAVVEHIHFLPDADFKLVGQKAFGRCLSDIAAMGGKPGAALVTVAIPDVGESAKLELIYQGLNGYAAQFDCPIVGGETTKSNAGIMISVSMLGTVSPENLKLRSTAKPGDAIFVSGELGGSISGKHLEFEPRVREAQWLVSHFPVHAMIDVSDGLAGDLRHILDASKVGAQVFSKTVPISRAAKMKSRSGDAAKPALLAALTDGEDFELLFTLPARYAVPLADQWKISFPGVKISCIGKITDKPGLFLCDENGIRGFNAHGFDHFS
ncbi:MAG: Thiamine-monophosphate kinase [Verrucomicrobiales bacterium]|nr:Thiamine-monophosphate kinase [Verrucomicrobiales bacterium]